MIAGGRVTRDGFAFAGGRLFAMKRQPPKNQAMLVVMGRPADPKRAHAARPQCLDANGTTAIDWFAPSLDGASSPCRSPRRQRGRHAAPVRSQRRPASRWPTSCRACTTPPAAAAWRGTPRHGLLLHALSAAPASAPPEDATSTSRCGSTRSARRAARRLRARQGSPAHRGDRARRRATTAATCSPTWPTATAASSGSGCAARRRSGAQIARLRRPRVAGALRPRRRALPAVAEGRAARQASLRLPLADARRSPARDVIVARGRRGHRLLRARRAARLYVIACSAARRSCAPSTSTGAPRGALARRPSRGARPRRAWRATTSSCAARATSSRRRGTASTPRGAAQARAADRARARQAAGRLRRRRGRARHRRLARTARRSRSTSCSRRARALDGSNPVLLTGYGGYGISCTPRFTRAHRALARPGRRLAVANLRGGGEFGDDVAPGGQPHEQAERVRRLHRRARSCLVAAATPSPSSSPSRAAATAAS